MTPARFFCSQAARERGETLRGTAPLVETWLLIENPASWTSKSFPDNALPATVRSHIANLQGQIPRSRPLMVRQCHSRRSQMEFHVVCSSEVNPVGACRDFIEDEDLLDLNIATLFQSLGSMRPMYLVCTHGKHDQCCAKFGFATFCALRDVAETAAWECSHVGGDRFAGNVLCLPHGLYYGHVMPEDAQEIVTSYEAGRISLRHYRGRSAYSRPAQAAEYFLRSETGILGLNEFRLVGIEGFEEACWRVKFSHQVTSDIHQLDVRVSQSSYDALLTCKAVNPQPVRGWALLRHVVVEVDV